MIFRYFRCSDRCRSKHPQGGIMVIEEKKTCEICEEVKATTEFHTTRKSGNPGCFCKLCHSREKYLRRKNPELARKRAAERKAKREAVAKQERLCSTCQMMQTVFSTKVPEQCRTCYKQQQRAVFYAENKDRIQTGARQYRVTNYEKCLSQSRDRIEWKRAENPVRYMALRAKGAAKSRGIEWGISEEDLLQIEVPKVCPILNIALISIGSNCDSSPSFDRIDSTKGYVPGNVAIISWRANTLKNDGTALEHELVAQWMRREGQV